VPEAIQTSIKHFNHKTIMLKDFNLLITSARGKEINACSEMWYLLDQIGDENPKIDKTRISGLITGKTSLPTSEAIPRLRELLRERPLEFGYSLRIIPIQKVVQSRLEDIEAAVTQLSTAIKEDETFRVTLEKRFTNLSAQAIIETAAARIQRQVDLTNPDKIVLIEILGRLTGISVIEPVEIISVPKERPKT
jgi:tRNA acetyltransferase TAN1